MIGDRQRIAILTISEQELPFVIGAPKFVGTGARESFAHPRWGAHASRSGCSSPPGKAACARSDAGGGFCRSALARHIPGSVQRSCSRSYGRSQTLCKVPPSASRRPTNCSPSSIAEHSFHGILAPSPKGESVTHVSGTMCYLCLRPLSRLQHAGLGELLCGRKGKISGLLITRTSQHKRSRLLGAICQTLRHYFRVAQNVELLCSDVSFCR